MSQSFMKRCDEYNCFFENAFRGRFGLSNPRYDKSGLNPESAWGAAARKPFQLPTSSTSRRGGYSYGFDLHLDPIRFGHVGALKRLSMEEHDREGRYVGQNPGQAG